MSPLPHTGMARSIPSVSRLAVLVLLGTVSQIHATPPDGASGGGSEATEQVDLRWFGDAAADRAHAATFGVPWPEGSLRRDAPLALCLGDEPQPTQTWPLAFWPDGSVKWTGVATVVRAPGPREPVSLRRVAPPPPETALRCEVGDDTITIDNGPFRSVIGRRGDRAIIGIRAGDTEFCSGARLLAVVRRRGRVVDGVEEKAVEFLGRIDRASVESAGPVRVVVKIEGAHVQSTTGERVFPFVLRLTFHAGDPTLHATHSFVYDGNPSRDFLQGIGMAFEVPLRDSPHQRHVWFGADRDGVWSEQVRSLPPMLPNSALLNPDRSRQLAGERVDIGGQTPLLPHSIVAGPEAMPIWGDFRLVQHSADMFAITKSCGPDHASLPAYQGHRAAGVVAVTDARAGLAVGQHDFWQSHPSEMEIVGAAEAKPTLTAWFWSPRADASDMRHYADKAHGALYENAYPFQWQATPNNPDSVNAHGTGRSSRLRIWPLAQPNRSSIAARTRETRNPPLLVCTPAYYHSTNAFGIWSQVSRQTPGHAAMEDMLTAILDFYLAEVDRRSWYGFWDYGDIRHSYDPVRHVWRYDEGGYGWLNNEGMPELWLWYSFLRTGREDVFRFATAMGRHHADVDVFHLGPHAGKGSRHNVSHWGCNVKTERVSQAAGRRFLYYLTADEQIGERLDEVLAHHPAGVVETQVSPGWSSYCSNWLTAAERSGEPGDRDKLLAGINGLLASENPFVDRRKVMLDMSTGRIEAATGTYGYHMTLPFGGPQVWMEMAGLFRHEAFADALARYGRELRNIQGETAIYAAGLIAFAAARLDDPELASRAWEILRDEGMADLRLGTAIDPVTGSPIQELLRAERGMGQTVAAMQWSLSTIHALQLIPGALDPP